MPETLLEKIWALHRVTTLEGGYDLLHVDRHLLHDLSGPASLRYLQKRGLRVRNPELSWAMPDHCVSTAHGRTDASTASGAQLIPILRERCLAENIRLFDINDDEQGIVHVVGPEQGLSLPGTTIVCGDSHTCTHGGVGALAWGIGSSELNHVLATQTVIEKRPASLRLTFSGELPHRVTAKDMILAVIARFGANCGVGHAVEFAGTTVAGLGIEARLTLCNLSIELGAKMGQIAPDDHTFDYLCDKPYAPREHHWDRALAHWQSLPTDPGATFDKELFFDVSHLAPQLTWGISPEHAMDVDGVVPQANPSSDAARQSHDKAYEYMGLQPGQRLTDVTVQRVFIGSCTNSRLSDLTAAAALVAGRKVADGVIAWVVPGSQRVKQAAEDKGLDKLFLAAGFQWREPGCSMCVGTNGEFVAPGERCISTSNRNFVGRQGPGARTHLASPLTAAASAIAGRFCDPRTF